MLINLLEDTEDSHGPALKDFVSWREDALEIDDAKSKDICFDFLFFQCLSGPSSDQLLIFYTMTRN